MAQMHPAEFSVQQQTDAFPRWREALPKELRVEVIQQWNKDSIWILVLMAICYRLECMVYRLLQKHYDKTGAGPREWAIQQLHSAMFELDTIIRRASMRHTAPLLPMAL
jgi:hypothetical protein